MNPRATADTVSLQAAAFRELRPKRLFSIPLLEVEKCVDLKRSSKGNVTQSDAKRHGCPKATVVTKHRPVQDKESSSCPQTKSKPYATRGNSCNTMPWHSKSRPQLKINRSCTQVDTCTSPKFSGQAEKSQSMSQCGSNVKATTNVKSGKLEAEKRYTKQRQLYLNPAVGHRPDATNTSRFPVRKAKKTARTPVAVASPHPHTQPLSTTSPAPSVSARILQQLMEPKADGGDSFHPAGGKGLAMYTGDPRNKPKIKIRHTKKTAQFNQKHKEELETKYSMKSQRYLNSTTVVMVRSLDNNAPRSNTSHPNIEARGRKPNTSHPNIEARRSKPNTSHPNMEARGSKPNSSHPNIEARGRKPNTSHPNIEARGRKPNTSHPNIEARGNKPNTSHPSIEAHGDKLGKTWSPKESRKAMYEITNVYPYIVDTANRGRRGRPPSSSPSLTSTSSLLALRASTVSSLPVTPYPTPCCTPEPRAGEDPLHVESDKEDLSEHYPSLNVEAIIDILSSSSETRTSASPDCPEHPPPVPGACRANDRVTSASRTSTSTWTTYDSTTSSSSSMLCPSPKPYPSLCDTAMDVDSIRSPVMLTASTSGPFLNNDTLSTSTQTGRDNRALIQTSSMTNAAGKACSQDHSNKAVHQTNSTPTDACNTRSLAISDNTAALPSSSTTNAAGKVCSQDHCNKAVHQNNNTSTAACNTRSLAISDNTAALPSSSTTQIADTWPTKFLSTSLPASAVPTIQSEDTSGQYGLVSPPPQASQSVNDISSQMHQQMQCLIKSNTQRQYGDINDHPKSTSPLPMYDGRIALNDAERSKSIQVLISRQLTTVNRSQKNITGGQLTRHHLPTPSQSRKYDTELRSMSVTGNMVQVTSSVSKLRNTGAHSGARFDTRQSPFAMAEPAVLRYSKTSHMGGAFIPSTSPIQRKYTSGSTKTDPMPAQSKVQINSRKGSLRFPVLAGSKLQLYDRSTQVMNKPTSSTCAEAYSKRLYNSTSCHTYNPYYGGCRPSESFHSDITDENVLIAPCTSMVCVADGLDSDIT